MIYLISHAFRLFLIAAMAMMSLFASSNAKAESLDGAKVIDPASFEFDVIYFRGGAPKPRVGLMDSVTNEDYVRDSLKGVADFLNSHKDLRVGVVGFSDKEECSGIECNEISERRALLVYKWLKSNGVNEDQLYAHMGRGIGDPVDLSHTELQRQSNRRAEIRVVDVKIPGRTGRWYE